AKGVCDRLGVNYIFKSSYDKVNRSSVKSYRGPGLAEGVRILKKVRATFGCPTLTDFHSAEEAEPAAEGADILQVPAFLVRQTDVVAAGGRTGRVINVKKGQFMAPWDMQNVCEKLEEVGNSRITLTERGATFGYGNLIVDPRSFYELKKFGYPVVFDATHSVQLPGGLGHTTDGKREYIYPQAKAAIGAGIDGLFIETHPDVDHALSDKTNQLPLEYFEPLLARLKALHEVARDL
ncbi:MAG TPA: 3-deoxy-8-phosphooctulonate synthase, partial [bacterium]|nr:3-deoxy-8-phosphooctulonate synthase [bacterium]